MEKISVVIPVYNVEEYLSRCVESVLAQSYSELEIILINDGSKDKSGQICDAFAKADSRVVVVHKENSGVSDTRNIGIARATGQYIAFIDADDWLQQDYIEKLYNAMIATGASVATCGYIRKYQDADKIETVSLCDSDYTLSGNRVLEYASDKKTPFVGFVCGKLYLKQLLVDNCIEFDTEIKLCEDSLFNYQVFIKCEKAVIIKESLYNYLIRGDSATRNANKCKEVFATRIKAFERAVSLTETFTNDVFEKRVNYSLFEAVMIYSYMSMKTKSLKDEYKELKEKAVVAYKKSYKKYISLKMRMFFYLFRIFPVFTGYLVYKKIL